MIITYIEGNGLLLQPEPTPVGMPPVEGARWQKAQAAEQAETWLSDHGLSTIEIAELDVPGRVRFAWWDSSGAFVQPGHDGATLVLVADVPVPPDLRESAPAPGPQPIPPPEGGVE